MYKFQKLEMKRNAYCKNISKSYTLHILFVNISSTPNAHKKARIEPKTKGSSNVATPNSNAKGKLRNKAWHSTWYVIHVYYIQC